MPEEDLYRKLQQHLDRMPVAFPPTQSGVEIRLLRQLFTPREARIVLGLSALPEPPSAVHRRLRRDFTREEVADALGAMAARGVIVGSRSKRGPRYGKMPFVLGMYEAQVDRLTEQFERDARQYMDEAFGTALHSGRTPQLRTVPVNVDVIPERGVAQYDDVREIVRNSAGPFAALNCICRQGHELLHEPCRQTDARRNCLMLGAAAKAMVDRGAALPLTREEMLGCLDIADREGLVLQPQNTRNPLFVCCCCGCCCGVLTTAKKLPKPAEFFNATYCAEVDVASCQACGECENRCQMDAIACHDGLARVDDERCIGCGLCASTCPSGAMRLRKKEHRAPPPKDTAALYGKIFRERYGPWGVAMAVGRSLFGLKT